MDQLDLSEYQEDIASAKITVFSVSLSQFGTLSDEDFPYSKHVMHLRPDDEYFWRDVREACQFGFDIVLYLASYEEVSGLEVVPLTFMDQPPVEDNRDNVVYVDFSKH